MKRVEALTIGGAVALLTFVATDRQHPPPPPLSEVLDLTGHETRLVLFQPADCERSRRSIVREVVGNGAIPVVLYADRFESDDLGRLLGKDASEVEVRRMPDVGLEGALRFLGVRSTPFVLTLDENGTVTGIINDIEGEDS